MRETIPFCWELLNLQEVVEEKGLQKKNILDSDAFNIGNIEIISEDMNYLEIFYRQL